MGSIIKNPPCDGVGIFKVNSWKSMNSFLNNDMLNYDNYIWRGQRCENWKLEPSLNRVISKIKERKTSFHQTHDVQFNNFMHAIRGRLVKDEFKELDLWSIGQHYGLATPLLDWTRSPFVATFFAYEEESDKKNNKRAVYALNQRHIEILTQKILLDNQGKNSSVLKFIDPLLNENPRLVNQNGLFTYIETKKDVETWVKENFKGENESFILMKFILPEKERETCLKALNRMNINHLTLYPDLHGAAQFCNLKLLINNY